MITYEIIHEARVIPLDGRPHVGSGVRMHMGDARGRWEGDTLVVETTNFTQAPPPIAAPTPPRFRVVERFTRVAPTRFDWTATMEDPATWTRPWTIAMPLVADTQSPILPFECHEHNYGVVEHPQSCARGESDIRRSGPAPSSRPRPFAFASARSEMELGRSVTWNWLQGSCGTPKA